jgi:hypothetical protein
MAWCELNDAVLPGTDPCREATRKYGRDKKSAL